MGFFSLVAQLVKNQPAMRETWVQSLGWEDPLEESMTTHSSILPGESPWTEEPGRLQSMGSQESDTTERLHFPFLWVISPMIIYSPDWLFSRLKVKVKVHGLYSPWNSPGQNTGVGSLSLLQRIFPTQGLNPGLPHCRLILYQLSYPNKLR